MCGRYIPLTLRQVLHVIDVLAGEAGWGPDDTWRQVPREVYPGDDSQLIIPFEEGLQPVQKRWGYEVSWRKGPIFNTRIESALEGGMWRDSIRNRRCLVPCRAFFEPHRTETIRSPRTGRDVKRQYEFWSPDEPVLLLAGIWQDDRYSIVTTEANDVMRPIHDRMPIVMTPEEAPSWLGPAYPTLAELPTTRLSVEATDLLAAARREAAERAAAGRGTGQHPRAGDQGRLF